MLTRTRSALRAASLRRRAPQTLVEFAGRLEFDAAGVREHSQTLSPARLAVVVGDVSLASGHLVDATNSWSRWLGCDANTLFAVDEADVLALDARKHLRNLRAALTQARDDAGALSASLTELSRHDGRSGATS